MPRKREKRTFRMQFLPAKEKIFPFFCMQSSTVLLACLFILLVFAIFLVAQVLSAMPCLFLIPKRSLSMCSSDARNLFICPSSDPSEGRLGGIDVHCLAWGQVCILLPSICTVISLSTQLSASWKCAGPKWTFSGRLFLPWIDTECLKRENMLLGLCRGDLPPPGEYESLRNIEL